MAEETFTDPFIEGDNLANYLITQNVSTAILQIEPDQNQGEEDDVHVNILEEINQEVTSPVQNSIEVKAELDLPEEEPQLPPDAFEHDNLLIDSLLEELEEVKVELNDEDVQKQDSCEDKEVDNLEEMEVDASGGDQLSNDKDEGKEVDWNWEPDEQDEEEDNEVNEEDNNEEISSGLEEIEEDLVKATSATSNSAPSQKKSKSRYIKKGRSNRTIRTADGKFKCRYCDQSKLTKY